MAILPIGGSLHCPIEFQQLFCVTSIGSSMVGPGLGHGGGPFRMDDIQLRRPMTGLLWAMPCMAHDGPHRLCLGPTWPKFACLFVVIGNGCGNPTGFLSKGLTADPHLTITDICSHRFV